MPVIKAPAGTQIGNLKRGGKFLSMAQAREAKVVSVRGGNVVTLSSRLPEVIAGLQIRTNTASREIAELILEEAQANLRRNGSYESGDLHDSLYVTELDLVGDFGVATDIPYAPYVEFGTETSGPAHSTRTAAKPFLVPAAERYREEHIAATAASLRKL